MRAASTAWRMTATLPGRLERVVGAEAAGHLEDAARRRPSPPTIVVGRALAAARARAGPRTGRRRRSARRPAGGSRRRRRGRPCRRRTRRRSSPPRPSRCTSPRRGPVERPQANRHARSSGASGLTFASAISGITVYSANVERAHEVADRLAVARQARRAVGQVALVLLLADREAEVRLRAAGSGRTRRTAARTASRRGRRARRESTPSPTRLDDARALVAEHGRRVAATGRRPRPCTGRCGRRRRPRAARAPRPARGSARSTSCTTSGAPNSSSTAARIFMGARP